MPNLEDIGHRSNKDTLSVAKIFAEVASAELFRNRVASEISGGDLSKAFVIDVIDSNFARIATPFLYPNGENVDVFLRDGGLWLSDGANTFEWITDLLGDDVTFRSEALDCFGVELSHDALGIQLASFSELPAAILRLGQACAIQAWLAKPMSAEAGSR